MTDEEIGEEIKKSLEEIKKQREAEDAVLSPAEREFKKMHPNTWRVIERERQEQEGSR